MPSAKESTDAESLLGGIRTQSVERGRHSLVSLESECGRSWTDTAEVVVDSSEGNQPLRHVLGDTIVFAEKCVAMRVARAVVE